MPDGLAGLRCPQCEYDLTGLREYRCPECGAEFDPDVLSRKVVTDASGIVSFSKVSCALACVHLVFQALAFAAVQLDIASPDDLLAVAHLAAFVAFGGMLVGGAAITMSVTALLFGEWKALLFGLATITVIFLGISMSGSSVLKLLSE